LSSTHGSPLDWQTKTIKAKASQRWYVGERYITTNSVPDQYKSPVRSRESLEPISTILSSSSSSSSTEPLLPFFLARFWLLLLQVETPSHRQSFRLPAGSRPRSCSNRWTQREEEREKRRTHELINLSFPAFLIFPRQDPATKPECGDDSYPERDSSHVRSAAEDGLWLEEEEEEAELGGEARRLP